MNALGRYLLLTGLLDDFRESIEPNLLALANDKQPRQIIDWIAERFAEHIKGREIERNPRIHRVSG